MVLSEIARRYALDESVVEQAVELARRTLVPKTRDISVKEMGRTRVLRVIRRGFGSLLLDLDNQRQCPACKVSVPPGRFCAQCGAQLEHESHHCRDCKTTLREGSDSCANCGTPAGMVRFYHYDFEIADEWVKYSVLIKSPLADDFTPTIFPAGPIRLRIDSGCETGQLFGDATCECRDQLFEALRRIAEYGNGLVINIPRQDGRGMGLPFKLATLLLQRDLGVDTHESGALLEPNAARDLRTFSGALAILAFWGASSDTPLEVFTNNPKKLAALSSSGYTNVTPIPIAIEPNRFTEHHLRAKQEQFGHTNLVPSKKS